MQLKIGTAHHSVVSCSLDLQRWSAAVFPGTVPMAGRHSWQLCSSSHHKRCQAGPMLVHYLDLARTRLEESFLAILCWIRILHYGLESLLDAVTSNIGPGVKLPESAPETSLWSQCPFGPLAETAIGRRTLTQRGSRQANQAWTTGSQWSRGPADHLVGSLSVRIRLLAGISKKIVPVQLLRVA